MENIKLLLVDDDKGYRTTTKVNLQLIGNYTIYEAKNGLDGYETFKTLENLDVIVADVDMPKISGLEMVDLIRKDNQDIPIVVAIGLISPENVIEGYKHDIDNYIKKPYTAYELDGVIKALFKRLNKFNQIVAEEKKIIALGSYLLDTEKRSLSRGQKIISLSKREAQILYMLYRSKGKLVQRRDILKEFWGSEDDFFHSRSLDVFINRLRKYLKEDKSIKISTVRSDGLILEF